MTIICALHEPGVGTWIGSDTLVSCNTGVAGYKRKWFMGEGYALAACGANAALSIIEDNIRDVRADMSAPALFKWSAGLFREAGFKPKEEPGEPPCFDCSFILATPARVLSMDSYGGGIEFAPGECATRGSGTDVADGAVFAARHYGASAEETLRLAILAAMKFDFNCGGEVWIYCLKAG